MKKKLRVLVLMHEDLMPPEDAAGLPQSKVDATKTEYDILWALGELGHEAYPVGVDDDLEVLRAALEEIEPHITFNVIEEFHGVTAYGQALMSYLELMRRPYTGCNPRGVVLAHDKLLAKKVLAYHDIPTPRAELYPRGRAIRPPAVLDYPMFVKSSFEDASLGISQASIVQNDRQLEKRVRHMHQTYDTDVIVEEYIEGRELYLGMLGNSKLETFPVWEMQFNRWPEGKARIATAKVKWNYAYQLRHDIQTVAAEDLPPELERRIVSMCKRAWSALDLSGYARFDLRLTPRGEVYIIEVNPNPDLAHDEDFAKSAKAAGHDYPDLIQRILELGLAYKAKWKETAGA